MRGAWVILSLGVAIPCVAADAYPNRPVRVLVYYGPGSTVDLVARVISQQLGDQLGKTFVVDNRVGAAGAIGIGFAAKAPPDGYTLLIGETGLTMLPAMSKTLSYDVARDFTPITQIAALPMALVVHPGVKANTVKELIALAHANPGALNYASASPGSPVHLATELFKIAARANFTHVPYKGGGEMVGAVLGGQVQVLLTTMPTVLSQIQSGKVRGLAVTTDGKRSPVLPDVPSMSEAGIQGMTIYTWSGVFGPAGMPKEIVTKLRTEVVKALAAPAVKERFAAEGAETIGSTPEQFTAHVRNELRRWAEVVKSAGITMD